MKATSVRKLQGALAAVHEDGDTAARRPACCGVMAATVLPILRPAARAAARGTAAFLETVAAHAPEAGEYSPQMHALFALSCTYSQLLAPSFLQHAVSCVQMFKALQGTQAPRFEVKRVLQGCPFINEFEFEFEFITVPSQMQDCTCLCCLQLTLMATIRCGSLSTIQVRPVSLFA